jgi:hypothetical protein
MASIIKLKRGSGAPTSGTLAAGEPALDLTNNKLYSSTDGSDIVEISPTIPFDGQFADGSVSAPSVTFSSDTNTGFYRIGADTLGLATNGTLRAKWDSNFSYYSAANTSATYKQYHTLGTLVVDVNVGQAPFNAYQFQYNSGTVGSIVVNTSATAYNTSSDYRLKENVVPIENAVARIDNLNPVRFNFIADPSHTVDGFLAHEVTPVVPEAITGEKDAVDEEGNPVYQGIDQSKLVPLLVAAVQELSARVAALEAN